MFHAHTVALTFTVWPCVNAPPLVLATTIRSFDSSEWNVPEFPSAHPALIVLG